MKILFKKGIMYTGPIWANLKNMIKTDLYYGVEETKNGKKNTHADHHNIYNLYGTNDL